jgi:hypothetical protein
MEAAQEILVRVCELANDYRTRNMSPKALIAESGYLDNRDLIDIDRIARHVASNPKLFGEWIAFSEDKRVSEGWYLKTQSADGPYTVGYVNPSVTLCKTDTFLDASEACAVYIKRELEALIG